MPEMRRVVLASANRGKAQELEALLGSHVRLLLQSELGIASVPETGSTFAENALIKARHAARMSGLPALADDSGIEVDALAGAPGVYSARFAGDDADDAANVSKLLAELAEVPAPQRTARFHCVLACVRTADDPAPLLAAGVWEGTIAAAPAGSGGFGYDPVFIDSVSGLTVAQLPTATKNARSHRSRALAKLLPLLQEAGL